MPAKVLLLFPPIKKDANRFEYPNKLISLSLYTSNASVVVLPFSFSYFRILHFSIISLLIVLCIPFCLLKSQPATIHHQHGNTGHRFISSKLIIYIYIYY